MEWKTRSYQENCEIVSEYLNAPETGMEKEICLRIMRGDAVTDIRHDLKMTRRQWKRMKQVIAEGLLKAEKRVLSRKKDGGQDIGGNAGNQETTLPAA